MANQLPEPHVVYPEVFSKKFSSQAADMYWPPMNSEDPKKGQGRKY